jgi:MFS family permease
MMTPVARLILVRSVDRRELINAMVWVTLPALIGPLIGPALGGFITTYISWHWIFLINIPIGIVGIVLATIFIEDVRAETPDPFDPVGWGLSSLGIGGLVFGGSMLGLNFLPIGFVVALIGLWYFGTAYWGISRILLPNPVNVWHELKDVIGSGEFLPDLRVTLTELAVAFTISCVSGVTAGFLISLDGMLDFFETQPADTR